MTPQRVKKLPPDSVTILERSGCVFFARWDELLRTQRIVLKSSKPDDIHDLRVASRRFRAVLELFYPFLPETGRMELKKNVRTITRTLGRLRNIDEAQLFFQARNTVIPNAETVYNELSRMRANEFQRTIRMLQSFDNHSLDDTVRHMVSGLHNKIFASHNRFSLLAYLSEVSIRCYMPIHQSISAATQIEHTATRHALRIAIKKWRYFLEIAEQILECEYSSVLDQLKEYQSLLGLMNDIREFEVLLVGVKISKREQKKIAEIFTQEEAGLLHQFIQVMEQKPLAYAFLI